MPTIVCEDCKRIIEVDYAGIADCDYCKVSWVTRLYIEDGLPTMQERTIN